MEGNNELCPKKIGTAQRYIRRQENGKTGLSAKVGLYEVYQKRKGKATVEPRETRSSIKQHMSQDLIHCCWEQILSYLQ